MKKRYTGFRTALFTMAIVLATSSASAENIKKLTIFATAGVQAEIEPCG